MIESMMEMVKKFARRVSRNVLARRDEIEIEQNPDAEGTR
jgi:hypothetical protein